MAITCVYKDKVETHVLLQGSNYLFRSDPQRFGETFQQLEGMEQCVSLQLGVWTKMLSEFKKIVYSLTVFGVRYKLFFELEV